MKRIQLIFCLLVMCTMTMAQQTKSSYRGTTTTHVMGKIEQAHDLVLVVTDAGDEKELSLNNFSVLGYKGISIKGKATLDKNGKIVSTRDVVIKGAPSKVKSVSGTINSQGANIQLEGKAAGMFGFSVHYVGK